MISFHTTRTARSAILAAACATLIVQSATKAEATPITYNVEAGTELKFSNGDTEILTGSVTAEPTTNPFQSIVSVDLTLTGSAAEAGHFTSPGQLAFGIIVPANFFEIARVSETLTLHLDDFLGTPSPIVISSVDLQGLVCTDSRTEFGVPTCLQSTFVNLTATVEAGGDLLIAGTDSTSVPEPSTLPLFSAALVGLTLLPRRRSALTPLRRGSFSAS